jgi:hypothetical protein
MANSEVICKKKEQVLFLHLHFLADTRKTVHGQSATERHIGQACHINVGLASGVGSPACPHGSDISSSFASRRVLLVLFEMCKYSSHCSTG